MKELIELMQDSIPKNNAIQTNDSFQAAISTDSSTLVKSISTDIRENLPVSVDSGQETVTKIELQHAVAEVSQLINSTGDSIIIQAVEHKPVQNFRTVYEGFTLYQDAGKSIEYMPRSFWIEKSGNSSVSKQIKQIEHQSQHSQYNWALFISLISVAMLIVLKMYYQKFINQVFRTLVNFQLVEKMLREKNILARRAFLIMNINFLLMFGLLVLLLAGIFNISITGSIYYDYMFFLLIILTVQLIRLLILYSAGHLFDSMQTVIEHIHICFLINKNLGLILLPLVFSAIYIPNIASNMLLFTGLGLFILANIYKLIRSFQIFIRNGVLFYYAILYLCTLELLPLLISSKILIAMR